MRFGRRRQRERAAEADAEAEAHAAAWYQVARWVLPGPQPRTPPWRLGDRIAPYRGFRAGRGRHRPDPTGYDEPTSPDRNRWTEPRAGDPTLDPVLGDEDDEPWTP
jgi:hypothetical protein